MENLKIASSALYKRLIQLELDTRHLFEEFEKETGLTPREVEMEHSVSINEEAGNPKITALRIYTRI